jgi:hypothetical protein
MGSFVKYTKDTSSYHGKLLSLMAIQLILLAVNKCNPDLPGSIQIFSNCLGTLNKIKMENLPPYCIPTKCSCSDILKNIIVHCSDISFHWLYSHIKAHQDNNNQYGDLSRPAQLNVEWTTMPRRQSGRRLWLMRRSHNNFPCAKPTAFTEVNEKDIK